MGFLLYVCVFYFCFYITNKFLFLEGCERERGGNGDHGGRGRRGGGHG